MAICHVLFLPGPAHERRLNEFLERGWKSDVRALRPTPIRTAAESFVVEDAGGLALVYVYFEEDPSRQRLVSRLSGADAKG